MPKTRTLLVVEKTVHALGFFDWEDGRELAQVALDPFPHEFAVSGDETRAYVCHFGVALAEDEGPGGNTVSVVDIPTRKRIGTLDCGEYRRPHGIALDGGGRLMVLSEATSNLLIWNGPRSGAPDAVLPTGGRGSHWVTVTRDGAVAFCSNMHSGTVTAVFPHEPGRPPVELPVGQRPEGSVLDEAERRLYVACRESGEIAVIDVTRLRVLDPIPTEPGPVRIARDSEGRLLVALYHRRALAVIDPRSWDDQRLVDMPQKPVSVAYDPGSRCALLSTLGDEVCIVPWGGDRVERRIRARPGPDPVHVVTSETG